MAASPKKQLALDANLLLDLAEGKDFAHEFREEFQARGYEFLVPPTTVAELNVLSIYGGEPQKSFAHQALRDLRWSVRWREKSALNHASNRQWIDALARTLQSRSIKRLFLKSHRYDFFDGAEKQCSFRDGGRGQTTGEAPL